MKFFALGGKTLTFKELKLVFRSPLWFYLFTPINQPTPTTPFQSNWEVICSPCLPSSAPTQPFRKGYGVSLSLMQYLVWASAWYLSHCAVLQPQLLFFFFFLRLHRISISLKFILCLYCPLCSLLTSWTTFFPSFYPRGYPAKIL